MAAVVRLFASALLAAVLSFARLALGAEEEARFEVRIEAPSRLQRLLTEHVEISRWRTHERMNVDEFRRLYRSAPKEIAGAEPKRNANHVQHVQKADAEEDRVSRAGGA